MMGRMTTPWLSASERAAWVRLSAIVELLPGVLDSQLRRDATLTYFEYSVLAMLSEAPDHVLRMTALAAQTNATLPRLSNVVRRLQDRSLVERSTDPDDARATNVVLTASGWDAIRAAAPAHVVTVRRNVIDALTPEQVEQLSAIGEVILRRIDPKGALTVNLESEPASRPAAERRRPK